MNYIIMPSEHLEKIYFSKVAETCPESLRYSLDKKHFLLKYIGDQPDFIYAITGDAVGLPEYTHSQILEILSGSEWNSQG
tara:strand:+ start:248 stop:487 length:240 start_codon:yes stop_codon:yes gene_type:complete